MADALETSETTFLIFARTTLAVSAIFGLIGGAIGFCVNKIRNKMTLQRAGTVFVCFSYLASEYHWRIAVSACST